MGAEFILAIGTAVAAILAAITSLITSARAKRAMQDGAKVHLLVNSSMGAQLRLSMFQAQRIAEMTGKEEDRELFIEARRIYLAHEKGQDEVNRCSVAR